MTSSYEQDGGIGMVEICISSWMFWSMRVDIYFIVFKESAFVYYTIFINLILKSYSFVNTLD